jgi:hypothetical protein
VFADSVRKIQFHIKALPDEHKNYAPFENKQATDEGTYFTLCPTNTYASFCQVQEPVTHPINHISEPQSNDRKRKICKET